MRKADLQPIGSFSVLSDPDRKIIDDARRWMRHFWLEATPGASFKLDGLEHDAVFETMRALDDLAARTSGEPQLANSNIGAAQ